ILASAVAPYTQAAMYFTDAHEELRLHIRKFLEKEVQPHLEEWEEKTFPDSIFRRFGELRSEERTSELQSRVDLVCRLLRENKKLGYRARSSVQAGRDPANHLQRHLQGDVRGGVIGAEAAVGPHAAGPRRCVVLPRRCGTGR